MSIQHECGIFAGYSIKEPVAPFIKQGLVYLQHRGQESAGISTEEATVKNLGLVNTALPDKAISRLSGHFGIGHVRYSTQGTTDILHSQPFTANYNGQCISIAHNGNIKNADIVRQELIDKNIQLETYSDTEVILKKLIYEIDKDLNNWTIQDITDVMITNFPDSAWNIAILLPKKIIVLRDPSGYRPLSLCQSKEGYFIGSEDCAFQHLKAITKQEIEPGYAVEINQNGINISKYIDTDVRQCVFELIYFANPLSTIFHKKVKETRILLGKQTAIENPVDADIIVPVLESGLQAAIGYSEQTQIPIQYGLKKKQDILRTFIFPDQKGRRELVQQKLVAVKSIVNNRRVIIVDDSIVRGTTSKYLVKELRTAGAKEIHFRLSSPKIIKPCFWGVDIPDENELLAANYISNEDIADHIGADSVGFLSIKGLYDVIGSEGWCINCLAKNSTPDLLYNCDCKKSCNTIGV